MGQEVSDKRAAAGECPAWIEIYPESWALVVRCELGIHPGPDHEGSGITWSHEGDEL